MLGQSCKFRKNLALVCGSVVTEDCFLCLLLKCFFNLAHATSLNICLLRKALKLICSNFRLTCIHCNICQETCFLFITFMLECFTNPYGLIYCTKCMNYHCVNVGSSVQVEGWVTVTAVMNLTFLVVCWLLKCIRLRFHQTQDALRLLFASCFKSFSGKVKSGSEQLSAPYHNSMNLCLPQEFLSYTWLWLLMTLTLNYCLQRFGAVRRNRFCSSCQSVLVSATVFCGLEAVCSVYQRWIILLKLKVLDTLQSFSFIYDEYVQCCLLQKMKWWY